MRHTNRNTQPNPMSPVNGVMKYEKKRYAHFDQKIINSLEHRTLYSLLLQTNIRNGHILNVPCGFGRFTDILTSFHAKIVFFDLHPKMVSRCKEQFTYKNQYFINGSIRTLPFKNSCFDAVMNIRFFHHYFEADDRFIMLQEMHRVAKSHVILTYYCHTLLHKILKKVNRKYHRIVMFNRKDFYRELISAGFKVILEKTPLPLLHAQRYLLLKKI